MDNYNAGFAMGYYLAARYRTMSLLYHDALTPVAAKQQLRRLLEEALASMETETPIEDTPIWPTVCSEIAFGNDEYFFSTGEYDQFDALLEGVSNGTIGLQTAVEEMRKAKQESLE